MFTPMVQEILVNIEKNYQLGKKKNKIKSNFLKEKLGQAFGIVEKPLKSESFGCWCSIWLQLEASWLMLYPYSVLLKCCASLQNSCKVCISKFA